MRLVLHDRVIDLDTGQVQEGTNLTQFECSILLYLRAQGAEPASRAQLLVEVWGFPRPVASRCVDAAVRRIRKKIETDPAKPRHLLTLQGEGYLWRDGGAAAVSKDDRCCGRVHWSEQLAWAESAFGVPLDPHDPRVGIAQAIRATYTDETASLGSDARALLELLSLSKSGWTPTELAQHADAKVLRSLVQAQWVELDGPQARLGSLWWPVRSEGTDAHELAIRLWIERFRKDQPVDLLELLPVFRWRDVSPDQLGELLAVSRPSFFLEGLHRPLIVACDSVARHDLSPEQHCTLLLIRSMALFKLGLFAECRQDAEQALVLAEQVPSLLPRALFACVTSALLMGDRSAAAHYYPRAIELARGSHPRLHLNMRTDHARLLWDQGHGERAVQLCRDVKAAAAAKGEERSRLHAASNLACMLLGLGKHGQAISRLTTLYEHGSNHGPPTDAISAALYLGLAHLDLGELDAGDVWLVRARELGVAGEDPSDLAGVDNALGFVAALRGRWSAANTAQLRALVAFEDARILEYTLLPRCWIAVGAHRLGDHRLSHSMLTSALEMLRPDSRHSDRSVLAIACQVLKVEGPDVPTTAGRSLFARIARRAWEPS
jgi:tetratricopeptide (TPR) repeat protein